MTSRKSLCNVYYRNINVTVSPHIFSYIPLFFVLVEAPIISELYEIEKERFFANWTSGAKKKKIWIQKLYIFLLNSDGVYVNEILNIFEAQLQKYSTLNVEKRRETMTFLDIFR